MKCRIGTLGTLAMVFVVCQGLLATTSLAEQRSLTLAELQGTKGACPCLDDSAGSCNDDNPSFCPQCSTGGCGKSVVASGADPRVCNPGWLGECTCIDVVCGMQMKCLEGTREYAVKCDLSLGCHGISLTECVPCTTEYIQRDVVKPSCSCYGC